MRACARRVPVELGWTVDREGALTITFRNGARFALRERTAAAHDRVDAAFGRLDLASCAGLGDFLDANHRALRVVEPLLAGAPGLPPLPSRLAAIESGLMALDRAVPTASALALPDAVRQEPLGVAYVVGGSALGAQVLRRRWAATDDPAVRAADAFMDDAGMMAYWTAIQNVLRAIPADSTRMAAIAASAVATFRVFEDALQETIANACE